MSLPANAPRAVCSRCVEHRPVEELARRMAAALLELHAMVPHHHWWSSGAASAILEFQARGLDPD